MKALLIAVIAALALPASALAHAQLQGTSPRSGAVLATSPAVVEVHFDDDVRPGPAIEAIRNGGRSILAGKPRIAGGKTLVLPLEPSLPDGDYSVRWSIVSDDGHIESGVLAFAVGVGRAPPTPQLTAAPSGPRVSNVFARWLFLGGILAAAGVAFLVLLGARDERIAMILASGCILAAFGAADEANRIGLSTRAGLALAVGAVYAVVVALVGAAALLDRRVLLPAAPLALGLVFLPTASGHALDDAISPVNIPADLLHVAGAAAWIGALIGAVLLRRFDVRLAFGGVVLLAATGVVRALSELDLSQLWTTAYGRLVLVKSALLAAAVALGVLRRSRVELLVVAALVVAVAVLVLEPPGRVAGAAPARAVPTEPSPEPPRLPDRAYVLHGQLESYGIALGIEPSRVTLIVLSPAGGGASGLDVTVGGRTPVPCGSGCYRSDAPPSRTVAVSVEGLEKTFSLPASATPAADLVRRLGARFRSFDSVEYVEYLASGPGRAVTSSWRLEKPNRLSYVVGGARAIVIGARRWDQDAGSTTWVESPQDPLSMPSTQWSSVSNAYSIAPGAVTFEDPSVPAFFTVRFDPRTLRPRVMQMTAPAHFMTDSYVRFDSGPAVRPPR